MKRYILSETDISDWRSITDQLRDEYESGIDPLYEETRAGEYIQDILYDVEEDMGLFVEFEPSSQDGEGTIYITNDDQGDRPLAFADSPTVLADNIDYKTFHENIVEVAITSKSEEQFKKWYKSFLERCI